MGIEAALARIIRLLNDHGAFGPQTSNPDRDEALAIASALEGEDTES